MTEPVMDRVCVSVMMNRHATARFLLSLIPPVFCEGHKLRSSSWGHFVSHPVHSVSSGSRCCPQHCILKYLNLHMILGCYSVSAEDSCLLACYVTWTCNYVLVYQSPWWNILKDLGVRCRRIFGPICKGGQWRERYSRELEELHSEPNIVNVIKCSRQRWAGHGVRVDESELSKKVL